MGPVELRHFRDRPVVLMIYSAAPERLPLLSSVSLRTPANSRVPEFLRVAGFLGALVLGLATAPNLSPLIAAQTPAPRVRAEFQTSPRSLITQTIDRSRLVTTPGAVRREVATAQDLGPHDPSAPMEHMQLMLQRPQERQAAFDAEVVALHRRGDPSYHQWLTPETIGTEFGPSASDIATLTSYLQSEGFTVNNVGKSGMFVDFQARSRRCSRASIPRFITCGSRMERCATPRCTMRRCRRRWRRSLAECSRSATFRRIPRSSPHGPRSRRLLPRTTQPNATPEDTSHGNYNVGAQDFYTIYNEKPLLEWRNYRLRYHRCVAGRDRHQHRRRHHVPHHDGVSPATPTLTVSTAPGR